MMQFSSGCTGYDVDSPRNVPLSMKYHYWVFVKEAFMYKALPWKKVKRDYAEHVRDMLLQHFASTAKSDAAFLSERERIYELWSMMEARTQKYPEQIPFMGAYGANSRFFFTFLLDIPKGAAMLPAFFYGRDIFGKVVPIPSTDLMYQFCLNDPVFSSVRFRNEYEQKFLANARRPLILAGGTLPQLWYGYDFSSKLEQRPTVYDPDRTLIGPLRQIFGKDLARIDYHFEGFETAFSRENEGKYDFMSFMGLMSYRRKELEFILRNALAMTIPDAPIVFDWQTFVLPLLFDRFALGWKTNPPMKPHRNALEAVDDTDIVCKKLGARIDDYQIPPGEAGVVIRISKK